MIGPLEQRVAQYAAGRVLTRHAATLELIQHGLDSAGGLDWILTDIARPQDRVKIHATHVDVVNILTFFGYLELTKRPNGGQINPVVRTFGKPAGPERRLRIEPAKPIPPTTGE